MRSFSQASATAIQSAVCARGAGVGWVPFLCGASTGYDFAAIEPRLQAHIPLSTPTSPRRADLFTFEVEEEGGFRRCRTVRNFLWAATSGLDSPWPHSKVMGHAPAEAALAKKPRPTGLRERGEPSSDGADERQLTNASPFHYAADRQRAIISSSPQDDVLARLKSHVEE